MINIKIAGAKKIQGLILEFIADLLLKYILAKSYTQLATTKYATQVETPKNTYVNT